MTFASPTRRLVQSALYMLLVVVHFGCSPLGDGAPIEAADGGTNGDSTSGTNGDDNDSNAGSNGSNGSSSTGSNGDDGDDDDNVLRPCGQTTPLAQAAFETHCVSCHGAKPQGNALANILDVTNLTKSGLVIASKPEDSKLYARLVASTMPPSTTVNRPSASEISAIHDWIACGAPAFADKGSVAPQFTTVDQRLREMLDDVRSISNENDRKNTRYIELYTLANAGYSENQLELYRQAVSFLLNSLSRGLTVVAPQTLGEQRLLMRIDISDYGWDVNTWNEIGSAYPYGIVYDEDSQLFPYDESTAARLRTEVGNAIPYLQADWFLARCAKPPLYNRILELPETLSELETQLGVDLAGNVAAQRIERVGVRRAAASDANRVLERHDLGAGRGALWMTYDFSSNLGKRNIFANPLSFAAEGAEVIFPLPNGFFGYFVASGSPLSGEATQIDVAPSELVQDPVARDGRVTTGLSCMGCHQNGLIPRQDDVRPDVVRNGATDLGAVLAVYPGGEEMALLFTEDSQRYARAREAAKVVMADERTMHSVHDTHLDAITFQGVAAVLGITPDDLERALDQAASTLPREIISLRTPGSTIDRATLDDLFDEIIAAISLGQPINN